MPRLLSKTLTAAAAGQLSQTFVCKEGTLNNVVLQANFVYGSGGTSLDAYVQTSIDGGLTWIDVAQFNFTTSSARKVFNLSNAAVGTSYTPTDGSLTANTVKDGLLGPLWRVKYTSVGTYAGSTSIAIDAHFNGCRVSGA